MGGHILKQGEILQEIVTLNEKNDIGRTNHMNFQVLQNTVCFLSSRKEL